MAGGAHAVFLLLLLFVVVFAGLANEDSMRCLQNARSK
jgi:hypothetical protein